MGGYPRGISNLWTHNGKTVFMPRKIRRAPGLVVLALVLGMFLPKATWAATITLDTLTYDVTFTRGNSFDDDESTITASPWWGDAALAEDLARAYAAQVAMPFPFDEPGLDRLVFAYAYADAAETTNRSWALVDDGGIESFGSLTNASRYSDIIYAYGTLVPSVIPLPASGWLMLVGMGGLVALRRKRRG